MNNATWRRTLEKFLSIVYVLRSPIVPTYSLKDPTYSMETVNLDESLQEKGRQGREASEKRKNKHLEKCWVISLN